MKKIITEDQINQIITLSAQGYSNRQIAIETGMKHATLCSWKRKLRDAGHVIQCQNGRPRIKTSQIMTIVEENKIKASDK